MVNMTITHARLLELLTYDAASGVFVWNGREGRGRHEKCGPGRVAGHLGPKGYVAIKVDGVTYKAHRLAWFYVTGEWPPELIDHKDGVRNNNAFRNLRPADLKQNAQNTLKPSRNNKSGYLGVSWDKGKEKWVPTIHINGRNKRLGAYAKPEEAYAVYLRAKAVHHSFAIIGVAG